MAQRELNIATISGSPARLLSREMVSAVHDSLRTKQWTKNLLIFAGIIFSQNMFTLALFKKSCEAFVLFCLLASSIYLINDIADIAKDKLHPQKRLRPIASGRLSVTTALTMAMLLASSSIICAFALDTTFGAITVGYFILMNLYTFYLKKVVTVDVLIISVGFIIRAIAGAAVIHVTISNWLVICTTFLALLASSLVKTPRPGPISKTVSLGFISAEAMIFLIAVLSTKKFWPRALFGPNPWLLAIVFGLRGIKKACG